jgi:hypothetical protein
MIHWIASTAQQRQNASIVLLDVHGDLSSDLFGLKLRVDNPDRLRYIDPGLDQNYIPCLNPMRNKFEHSQSLDLYIQMRSKAFVELMPLDGGISLSMEVVLKAALHLLFTTGESGLADLQDMMLESKQDYWIERAQKLKHPVFRKFFQEVFPLKKYAMTKQAIYNRIQYLSSHLFFYHMLN